MATRRSLGHNYIKKAVLSCPSLLDSPFCELGDVRDISGLRGNHRCGPAWRLHHNIDAGYAEYREQCQVKYQSAEGWSKPYNVECIYISGDELNLATRFFQYNSTSVYAVVFWQPHQASVIKLADYGVCSLQVFG